MPVVCTAISNGHAVVAYGVAIVTPNYFTVGVMYVDGYVMSAPPDGSQVSIIWTY